MTIDETTCDVPEPLDGVSSLPDVSGARVVIAMSGGVDSSVAAALLAEQGYESVGISMRLYSTPQEQYSKSCCSPDDLFDARMVADKLGIPFYVANYEKEFRQRVVDYFVGEYRRGRTPNPCVACNNHLKFDILLKRTLALGSEFLATGHYARIDHSGPQPRLLKGLDDSKDQSYFLFGLPREALARILFPLGELTKDEVRQKARELELETAEKPESQEICFVEGQSYKEFVSERMGDEARVPGTIVHENGDVLGEHDGIHGFTIGQRRGLGIGYSEPLYVKEIRVSDGTIVVGPRGSLGARGLHAEDCNWLSFAALEAPMRCQAKIRYRSAAVPARVEPSAGGRVRVVFDVPQRAVSPGQAVVFYDGDEVLGGGWISEPFTETPDA